MAKSRFLFSFLIFICFGICFSVANADDNANNYIWKAGVASVNITPDESMWMAGYAARNHPSEGVLADIWAKVLVFEDASGKQSVLITMDLIGISKYISDDIRNKLKKIFGLTKEQIILSCSHTHTGPSLQAVPEKYLSIIDSVGEFSSFQLKLIKEYTENLKSKIVEKTGIALASVEPVEIYSGQGFARFAVNRREINSNSELNFELSGPVDHSVPVIKVEKKSGEIMAVIFGYACHNTTLSIYKFSGDYAGFAQLELEKNYPEAIAMFFAGAGADQNPLPRRTISYAIQYGKTLAASVEAVLSEPMQKLSSKLITKYSEIELSYGNPAPPEKEELLQIISKQSEEPSYIKRRANIILNQMEDGKFPMSCPYPIQFWRIGEQNLIVLGGEVVVDYSIRLKEIFGSDLFVMAYANEMMGYVPSLRIHREGGYEGARSAINGIVFNRPWASDTEEKIINEVIKVAEKTGVKISNVDVK